MGEICTTNGGNLMQKSQHSFRMTRSQIVCEERFLLQSAHRELARAWRHLAAYGSNLGTNPLAVVSMWPANGAPTWPGNTRAPLAAQCSSTLRRLARASSASEFFGKFQCG